MNEVDGDDDGDSTEEPPKIFRYRKAKSRFSIFSSLHQSIFDEIRNRTRLLNDLTVCHFKALNGFHWNRANRAVQRVFDI